MLQVVSVENVDKVNALIQSFSNELGWLPNEVVRDETKRLAQECMDQTPPWPNGSDGTSKAGEKVGIEAVRRDILKAVTPVNMVFKDAFKDKHFEDIIRRKDYQSVNAALENMPKLSRWHAVPFSEELHTKFKRGRYGRMKDQYVMTLDNRKHAQYSRRTEGHVGYVKAGFALIVAQLGGKVPAWVAKHFGYCKGRMDDQSDTENPHIKFENEVPMKLGSKYNYAFKKRAREMFERLSFLVKEKQKRAGLA
jgi:hypothetical protein